MIQSEIEKRNEAIIKYLGYKHIYFSNEDLSDIGGLETKCKIYSRIPLEVDYCLNPKHWVNDRHNFILITISGYDIDFNRNELKYHSSWDWLMPVVERIEKIKANGEDKYRVKSLYSVEITQNTCFIRENIWAGKRFEITKLNGKSKIEAVFIAVSDFCLTLQSKD